MGSFFSVLGWEVSRVWSRRVWCGGVVFLFSFYGCFGVFFFFLMFGLCFCCFFKDWLGSAGSDFPCNLE